VVESQSLFPEPELLVDKTVSVFTAQRISTIGNRIKTDPEAFQTALSSLSLAAIAASAETEPTDLDPLETMEPVDILREYFAKRYDLDSSFDDPTEKALKEDPMHKTLHDGHVNTTSIYKRRGKMGSYHAENPAGISKRDEMRYDRVRFFIERVQSWNFAWLAVEVNLSSAS